MSDKSPLVPVYDKDLTRSWPKHDDVPAVYYVPLSRVLETRYDFDAHFSAYSAPSVPKRLSTNPPAFERIDGGVQMVALVVDVDDPVNHAIGEPARGEWLEVERRRAAGMQEHFDAVYYETRGGYRLVILLEQPAVIASAEDYAEWRLYYLTWLAHLHRRFGILGDPGCRDWTRAYRLPLVVRSGKAENPVMTGTLGAVSFEPSDEDLQELTRMAAQSKAWKQALDGVSRGAKAATPAKEKAGAPTDALLRYAQVQMDARPPGKADGSGGSAALLAARFLYRELALPDDDKTRAVFDSWLKRCDPPWTDENEIQHKIDEGAASEAVAEGSGLHLFRIWLAFEEAEQNTPMSVAVQSANPDAPRVVRIGPLEGEIVDEVMVCLASRNGIYCRDNRLMAIMPPELPGEKKRLVALSRATVRGLITRCCRLEKFDARSSKWVHANPPAWLVDQVYDRVHWPGIPPITDFVDVPVLNAFGEVIAPGYDKASAIYYAPSFEPLPMPDAPTFADAVAAAERLLDLLCDFPIPLLSYRSAWLAALLTQFARALIRGPIPMVMVDGNARGSGKTNLVDMVAEAALGCLANKTPEAKDPDEFRKQFSSAVLAGDTIICFDNLTSAVGGAALDAALTNGGRWSDRILGTNTRVDRVVKMTPFATGNNIPLRDDLVRRLLYIRIESQTEKPEERSGFKHDIEGKLGVRHVLKHRAEIVRDCLIILRAHWLAGRPRPPMMSWGSFESWSLAVRAPIIWLGLPDPADGRRQLAEEVDEEPTNLAQLMAGLEKLQASYPGGFTAAQVAAACASFMPEDKNEELKEAVAALASTRPGAPPTSKQVGGLLKKYRGRPVGGRRICHAKKLGHDKVMLWAVSPV